MEVHLKDGTVFAIGGVKSILGKLVEREKLPDESQVFTIGPNTGKTEDSTEDREESEGREEKYQIDHEIDRGGMGSILQAKDLDLRRRVAMKVLIEGSRSSPQLCERFVKEAQVTGFLEHPNIIPIHELGADTNSRPFFTMKLITGESFGSILGKIEEGGPSYKLEFPLRRLLGIFIQVCNAVSFAHSRGVIHRDIKPSNVMIGEFGEVLLMDWGLAKIRGFEEILSPFPIVDENDLGKTQEGLVLGTPYYMPPEQASGDIDRTDERSDIFSLGAMLYEIITGKHLYSGGSLSEVLIKARAADFETPSKVKKRIQSGLEKVCLKACAFRQEDRHQTVAQMADEVKAFLDHRVVPEYNLRVWQKLSQILVIGVFFGLLYPLVAFSDIKYVLMYVEPVSAFMIIGVALSYQLLVSGPSLVFPIFRTRGLPEGAALKSDILVDGAFAGGILGSLLGFLSMAAALNDIPDPGSIGPNSSLGLLTILYFYVFLLVFQLESVRRSRQYSLFGNISPARPSRLMQYSTLFLLPNAAALLLILNVEGRIPFLEFADYIFGAVPEVVGNTAIIFAAAFGVTLIYHRFIFSFKELGAALEHLFAFVAGNEVEVENRTHAGAVLRFFIESFFIISLCFSLLTEIGALASMVNVRELAKTHVKNLLPALSSLIIYVVVNYVILRKFCGDGGYKASRRIMHESLSTTFVEMNGCFWAKSKLAILTIIGGNAAFLSLALMALLTSGMGVELRVYQIAAVIMIICFMMLVNLHRNRLRRSCEPYLPDAGADFP